jgi:hypothetical protein
VYLGAKMNSPFSEIALVLVRLNHVARFIVNANHCIMRLAIEFRVVDWIADCLDTPQGASILVGGFINGDV